MTSGRDTRATVLVSASVLLEGAGSGPAPVLLHVARGKTPAESRSGYWKGHLQGAVPVHLSTELAAPPTPGFGPRPAARSGPAPRRSAPLGRAEGLSRRGLRRRGRPGRGTGVVGPALGRDRRCPAPGRGLAAWRRIGGPLTTDVPDPAHGDAVVEPGRLPVLDAADAARLARQGLLLDARTAAQYRGIPGRGTTRPPATSPGRSTLPPPGTSTPTATSPMGRRCVRAFTRWARTIPEASACTAVGALPPRTRSPPLPPSVSTRRSIPALGRPGSPIPPALSPWVQNRAERIPRVPENLGFPEECGGRPSPA